MRAWDIYLNNKDIMSDDEVKDCFARGINYKWSYRISELESLNPIIPLSKLEYELLKYYIGNDFTWRYELDKLEPLETIKMTKLDYEMLKLLKKQGAKYICRDEGGVLNICDTEPYQNKYEEGIWWSTGETAYLSEYFSKLFQFVKWEDKKYYVIEYVLENYEIVEDK